MNREDRVTSRRVRSRLARHAPWMLAASAALVLPGCPSCKRDPDPIPTPDSPCVNYNHSVDPGCTTSEASEVEPNDTLSASTFVDATGTLRGSVGADSDFYGVSSSLSSTPDAMHSLHVDVTGGVRACAFVTCAEGHTAQPATSCAGGTVSHLPEGLVGCCRSGASFDVSFQCDRPDILETQTFFLFSQAKASGGCAEYSATYQFY